MTKIETILINKKIHYYKKTNSSSGGRYRCVEYCYDIFDKESNIIETKKHNALNKASVVDYNGTKVTKLEYWYKGKKHRNNAPAILILNGKTIIMEEWYHNGIKLNENEIKNIKIVLSRRKKVLKIMFKTLQKKRNI